MESTRASPFHTRRRAVQGSRGSTHQVGAVNPSAPEGEAAAAGGAGGAGAGTGAGAGDGAARRPPNMADGSHCCAATT
eukprot:6798599-Prymnesium_polylepis.2